LVVKLAGPSGTGNFSNAVNSGVADLNRLQSTGKQFPSEHRMYYLNSPTTTRIYLRREILRVLLRSCLSLHRVIMDNKKDPAARWIRT
jgi:hypothetical protein